MKSTRYSMKVLICALSFLLITSFLIPLLSPMHVAADVNTLLDLSDQAERYLSDQVIATGGTLSFDSQGNITFKINAADNNMKFKCTGLSAVGEQNAVCIKYSNKTESTKFSIKMTLTDFNENERTEIYEETINKTSTDSYLFIPCPQGLLVSSITIKAIGVKDGSFTVMEIWNCYHYFDTDGASKNVGSLNTLKYIEKGSSVLIEGIVNYDIAIASKNSTINVYRLLPGEKINQQFLKNHSPCASVLMSTISRMFTFVVDNSVGSDFVSAYAVVIQSENGRLEHIIEDRRFPDPSSDFESPDVSFKGIASSLEFLSSRTYSDTLVIDIPTDTLISDKLNGYLYSFCGENYCFESNMIGTIDRRITSVASKDHSVYFRLLESTSNSEKATVFDASGERSKELYALISFLCERYAEDIGGIIVGNKFDIPTNYTPSAKRGFGDYIEKYSDYVSIVSAALRNNLSNARVIVPLSSNNIRIYAQDDIKEQYPMSAMLISFLKRYSQINRASITFMLCDETFVTLEDMKERFSPGSNTSGTESRNIAYNGKHNEAAYINAENTQIFRSLLHSLSGSFDFIDSNFFFSWEPKGIFSKEELRAAYAYTYFELCAEKDIYSFICDFTKDELMGIYSSSECMTETIAVMGSEKAKEYVDLLTKELGNFTFAGIDGYNNYIERKTSIISIPTSSVAPTERTGYFPIIDFSNPSSLPKWETGAYTDYIIMASVTNGRKAVKAHMNLPGYSSEFAEIVYFFDKDTDLTGVSDLTFTLMISTPSSSTSESYTVRTVVGGANVRCVSSTEVRVKDEEHFIISLDLAAVEDLTSINYIKICVQNMSGHDDKIVTSLIAADAYSTTLSNKELKAIFTFSDENTINLFGEDTYGVWKTVAYIAVTALSFFVIFIIRFYGKANAEKDDDDETEENNN